jgi:hypothetical protein
LTGGAANEEISRAWRSSEGTDVIVDWHSWKLAFNEPAALFVDLNELHCAHPDRPQTERVAADTTEEIDDIQRCSLTVKERRRR